MSDEVAFRDGIAVARIRAVRAAAAIGSKLVPDWEDIDTLLRLLDEAAAREKRLVAGLDKVIEIASGPGALDSRYRAIAENARGEKP